MKIIIFLAAIFTVNAQATTYEDAFQRTYNDYCNSRSNYIGDNGAKQVAGEVAENRLDLNAFMIAWDRSCSYNTALHVGRGVKANRLNLGAFELSHNDYCYSRSNYIGDNGAKQVAEEVASGNLDLRAFMSAWDLSCSYNTALDVGRGVKDGSLDQRAFEIAHNDYCDSRANYIGDNGAKQVAQETARGQLNFGAFMRAWDRSCSFNTALEVGRSSVERRPSAPEAKPTSNSGTAE
jgi:hypothetical protein